MNRILVWFSCGASSAVAAKLAVKKYNDRAHVLYCDTMATEHPDNRRFLEQVETWIGCRIQVLRSTKYATVDDVFEKRRYMAGPRGALCTTEMKKFPREAYQEPTDTHVFGFTADEWRRIAEFEKRNPELDCEWILADHHITKAHCLAELRKAAIPLPAMYGLGFDHNNCIGCVKATSPGYWNKIRQHFPDVFERRCEQSRRLGVRLVTVHGQRTYLDDLPRDFGLDEPDGEIECGPVCQQLTLW